MFECVAVNLIIMFEGLEGLGLVTDLVTWWQRRSVCRASRASVLCHMGHLLLAFLMSSGRIHKYGKTLQHFGAMWDNRTMVKCDQ